MVVLTAAIVLAAGLGRRLARATSLPKWLAPVGETCPATAQLTALARAGIGDVFVVVGDAPVEIEQHLSSRATDLDVELVSNEHSATLNNWYSLLLGLRRALARRSDDVLVLNSDLYASSEWFERSIATVRGTGHGAALAVDPTRGCTDEAMKVAIDDRGELVTRIGKTGVEDPGGEYVGLAWWRRESAAGLMACLEEFLERPDRVDHWYEHGIQHHLDAGAAYGAAPVASPAWVEIDDEDDLQAARALHD